MKNVFLTLAAILALIVLVLLVIQSQSPPSLPAQASPKRVVSESTSTRPAASTYAPSTRNGLTPPSLLYLNENRLYQQQPDGTTLMIASLGDEGDVMSAIKLKDTVFVLRRKGLQRVELRVAKQGWWFGLTACLYMANLSELQTIASYSIQSLRNQAAHRLASDQCLGSIKSTTMPQDSFSLMTSTTFNL